MFEKDNYILKVFEDITVQGKLTSFSSLNFNLEKYSYNYVEGILEIFSQYAKLLNKMFIDNIKQIAYFKLNKKVYRFTINYDVNFYFEIKYEKELEKVDNNYVIDISKFAEDVLTKNKLANKNMVSVLSFA